MKERRVLSTFKLFAHFEPEDRKKIYEKRNSLYVKDKKKNHTNFKISGKSVN